MVAIGVLKYGYRAHTHGAGQVHWAAIAGYKEIAVRDHSGKNSQGRLKNQRNIRLQPLLEELSQFSLFGADENDDFHPLPVRAIIS